MDIRIYGDPVLRKQGAIIALKDIPSYKQTVQMMFEKMYESNGIGLAAQQVGLDVQIAVIDTREPQPCKLVLINPEIISYSSQTSVFEEGCLSFPDIHADIERPDSIEIRYYDIEAKVHTDNFDGLLARVAQHEIDHLKGVLFIDRMPAVSRMFLKKKLAKLKSISKMNV